MQSGFQQTLQQFLGIPPAKLGEIAAFFKPKTLKKDAFFLKSGQYADQMAFLQHGLVREFLIDDKGREITKWIATPGYFITDIAGFMFRQPARCYWQALTDCDLLVLQHDDYRRLNQLVPQWTELEKLFLAKCFVTLENRVVSHLSLSSEERYQLLFEQQPELFNQAPLQYLASMLGMTPETFSRVRRKNR